MTTRELLVETASFLFLMAGALLLLWWPGVSLATDDHTMREVEVAIGTPSEFVSTTCGGAVDKYGDSIKKWPCTRWIYRNFADAGTDLTLYFSTTNKTLRDCAIWDPVKGEYLGADKSMKVLEIIHEGLHEIRGATPKKSKLDT